MKHRYEALLVLNTQGREDTVKEVVDRLESEFQQEGRPNRTSAENGQTPVFLRSRLAQRRIYVNFVFSAEPQSIAKLRSKFKLDPEVYRQSYQRVEAKEGKARKKDGESEVTWL
jgi:small subunit ribosomal protein S6